MEMGRYPKQANAKIKSGYLGANMDSDPLPLSPEHRSDSGSMAGPSGVRYPASASRADIWRRERRWPQFPGHPNHFGFGLSIALAPLAFTGRLPLAIAHGLELSHDGGLTELSDGAANLTHRVGGLQLVTRIGQIADLVPH